MWWMLAREVLRMRGTISREHPWEVMPDLYFYRDPEEVSVLKSLWSHKQMGHLGLCFAETFFTFLITRLRRKNRLPLKRL
jgi:hypothetical protein